jgi:hypothetical protein
MTVRASIPARSRFVVYARAEQILAERLLVAQNAAQAAGTQIVETGGRVHLRRKALAYIERQEARGKLSQPFFGTNLLKIRYLERTLLFVLLLASSCWY